LKWTKTGCGSRAIAELLGCNKVRTVKVGLCVLLLNQLPASIAKAQSSVPAARTFARDRASEDTVAKSLNVLLADQHITGLKRYDAPLLSEGVCTSIRKQSWVNLMKTDEGPQAFYQTNDPAQPSSELRKLAIDTALHYKPMARLAVAVWTEKSASGSSQYWVAVVLAKSAISDWFGGHLGADTPQEMRSPNFAAVEAVVPECRHK
jgi:hypothetical protein